jgi:cytochrome c oxidase cbb3-type subunit 3
VLRTLFISSLAASLCMAADGDGLALFERHCALCHGIGATGGRGPALTRPKLAHAPDDAALKNIILEGIEPEMPATWFLDDPATAALVAYVRGLGKLPAEKLPGDGARGATVYAAQGCSSCHTLAGGGTPYGPDLSDIGARRSAAYIDESLVKPAAALPEGFLMLSVRTAAGKALQGVRLAETNFTVHLKDAQGTPHSLFKSEVASIERFGGKTPMPAYTSLTATQRQDLVAFLASQKGSE